MQVNRRLELRAKRLPLVRNAGKPLVGVFNALLHNLHRVVGEHQRLAAKPRKIRGLRVCKKPFRRVDKLLRHRLREVLGMMAIGVEADRHAERNLHSLGGLYEPVELVAGVDAASPGVYGKTVKTGPHGTSNLDLRILFVAKNAIPRDKRPVRHCATNLRLVCLAIPQLRRQ